MRYVDAGVLNIAYLENGDPQGPVAILLHGFPYDVHAFDEVAPLLEGAGCRVLVPYLRGFGPTRFLSDQTMRSGQQAALGHDLLAFMDALKIKQACLAGYDWGGRAACIVAALWPQRVTGLVSVAGYNIQHITLANQPADPEVEHSYWYQYYFHGERGRKGLERNRHALCKLLWQLWSPYWQFDDKIYEKSAVSFSNPDFVEVVIHSYRHRYGLVSGDPTLGETEALLARQPAIQVPTVVLDGAADGVLPVSALNEDHHHFSGSFRHQIIPRVGHNLPQEVPQAFAQAVLELVQQT